MNFDAFVLSVTERNDLTPSARLLLLSIGLEIKQYGRSESSIPALCARFNLSTSAISRQLYELRKAGVLISERSGKHGGNVYTIGDNV